jgi:hypothetical protein
MSGGMLYKQWTMHNSNTEYTKCENINTLLGIFKSQIF